MEKELAQDVRSIPLDILDSHVIHSTSNEPPNNKDLHYIELQNLPTDLEFKDIKPEILHQIRHFELKASRQLFYSFVRNLAVWLFVGCLIAVIAVGSDVVMWLEDERVSVIVILIIGILGIPFQIIHVIREIRRKNLSLIASILHSTQSSNDFQIRLNEIKRSAPKLSMEVLLKRGAIVANKTDPNHWMITSRKHLKDISITAWEDISPALELRNSKPFWIIVAKDYKFMDKNSETIIHKEAADFKKDSEYDKFKYFMDFQFILDLEEEDFFSDVEALLVYDGSKPRLYGWKTYLICLGLAIDVIYQMLFYCCTRHAETYRIVKLIKR